MKSFKRGLVGIGISIVGVLLGLGMWQRENVQALWEGMSYTDEQLKDQMETSKNKVQKALDQYEIQGIRDLTIKEEEQLMKGEITVEEALNLIINKEESQPTLKEEEAIVQKYQLDQPVASTAPAESTALEVERIVEKYVEKMYTLQATFLSELGGIEAKARAVFSKLPKEERNLSTAKKLAPTFINEGLALEGKCDGQVDALLNAFQKELKEIGADTTIVEQMREAYKTQKRLKKAYYLAAIK